MVLSKIAGQKFSNSILLFGRLVVRIAYRTHENTEESMMSLHTTAGKGNARSPFKRGSESDHHRFTTCAVIHLPEQFSKYPINSPCCKRIHGSLGEYRSTLRG